MRFDYITEGGKTLSYNTQTGERMSADDHRLMSTMEFHCGTAALTLMGCADDLEKIALNHPHIIKMDLGTIRSVHAKLGMILQRHA